MNKIEILEEIIEKIKDLSPEAQVEALKFMRNEQQEKEIPRKKIKKSSRRKKKNSQKVSGIGIQIQKLIQEGFFNKPKSMREISNKLIIKGFNIKLPYLSPQLLKFVRNSTLIRHKDSEGRYVYYTNNNSKIKEEAENETQES